LLCYCVMIVAGKHLPRDACSRSHKVRPTRGYSCRDACRAARMHIDRVTKQQLLYFLINLHNDKNSSLHCMQNAAPA